MCLDLIFGLVVLFIILFFLFMLMMTETKGSLTENIKLFHAFYEGSTSIYISLYEKVWMDKFGWVSLIGYDEKSVFKKKVI